MENTITNQTGSYKELIVWQRAMELVVEVYAVTELYPRFELYGLTGTPKNQPFQFHQISRKEKGEALSKIIVNF